MGWRRSPWVPAAPVNPIARAAPNNRLDAMDIWPEHAFQVSQELDHLFEAFNQPHVVPTSYTDNGNSSGDDGSESDPSKAGHNLATVDPSDNSADVFSLFTGLF